MNPLQTISPLGGRYYDKTELLVPFFSEQAFFKYRILVETAYLVALSEVEGFCLRKFTDEEKDFLNNLSKLSLEDTEIIKEIETKGYQDIPPTNHDVKAIEYFIKLRLEATSLHDCKAFVHFGLTSEDVNNLAYALMIKESLQYVILPKVDQLILLINSFAKNYQDVPMLARTHGQPASPTTVGKEFLVFNSRLKRQLEYLKSHKITGKLNGATGNYNAQVAAFPSIDWIKFSEQFISSLGIEPNLITTQVEPKDSYAEVFDCLRRINVILLDFSQDMWRYISDNWFIQKPVAGEIGSSTMPHKINPIDFENAEGNLGLANALFDFFSRKLPISRLQRDLSDSTVLRNIGVAFGHCLVAYEALFKGVSKIEVNKEELVKALQDHPEIITEGIQTILRREGLTTAYEQLKELTRGKKVTLQEIYSFVEQLDCSLRVKEDLKKINPANYVGISFRLCPE